MRARCAWCEADLGERPGGEGVTHGICAPCAERWGASVAPPADDEINDVTTEDETT